MGVFHKLQQIAMSLSRLKVYNENVFRHLRRLSFEPVIAKLLLLSSSAVTVHGLLMTVCPD